MTTYLSRRTAMRVLGAGVATAAFGTGTATAQGPTELFTYNPAVGELPENVAIDRRGRKYVSFPPIGEIRRISSDNTTELPYADFEIGSGEGVIGLEVHPNGTLYACLVTFNTPNSDTHGIWRVTPDGESTLYADLASTTFPNDILLFGRSLLVTETVGGAVLEVRENESSVWVQDPLLEGTGAFPDFPPLGANGIARGSDGTVYVANTEQGHIVEIPVNPDGSAGTPTVFRSDPRLFASDGLAIDTQDTLYVGVIGQDTVVRVFQDGTIETLATATDGLDGPSDVTFGTARGEQRSIFITNFALLNQLKPSLMKLDVGRPSRPIRPRAHGGRRPAE